MKFRPEVKPFLLASAAFGAVMFLLFMLFGVSGGTSLFLGLLLANLSAGYMLFFFRDPDRATPSDPGLVVAAASGKLAKIAQVYEGEYLKTDTVRISIFLEKSSDVNQHNTILVKGEGTSCLITQIVGPVCRRVVYWLRPDKTVSVRRGQRFGMMKFGSRLDMYFPKGDIEIVANIGDQVSAGQTVIARIVKKENQ